MKRWIARLLSALLLISAAIQASAASLPGYTLDEKLYKQVKDGSGLKAEVVFSKTGGVFSALDEAGNAFVNILLSGSTFSLRSLRGVGTMKGKEEIEVAAQRDGQAVVSFHLLKNQQLEQLTFGLLGNQHYVDRRDGGAIGALLTGQSRVWPGVLPLLLKVNTAESSWQTNVKEKLDAYSMKTTLWLQTYTQTESLRDADNRLQNRIAITVPVNQVKAFIKQLLLDVYADADLLSLLESELDQDQSAAYLQPAMLSDFFQALDQLPLQGNLVSVRLMDHQGKLLENQLVLPMGGVEGLDLVEYNFSAASGQTRLSLRYLPTLKENTRGAVTSLVTSGQQGDAGEAIYTGTLSLQPEAGTAGFTVDAEEGDVPARVYGFTLAWMPEAEVLDISGDFSTRKMAFSLRVEPQGQERLTPQSLRGEVLLKSRRNSAAATSFSGQLVWTDETSKAQLTADITGNTAPPWRIPDIDPAGAVRLDQMSMEERGAAAQQAQSTLQSALAALLLRFSVPEATAAP